MRKTSVVCVLLAVLVGTLVAPADAAKRKPTKVSRRTVFRYDRPALGSPSTKTACTPCTAYPTFATERWVTMEVADDFSSSPVAFSIVQDADGDGTSETVGGPFCGSSGERPVEIAPGVHLGYIVYASGDVVCPSGVATTGTVTAVFSNIP